MAFPIPKIQYNNQAFAGNLTSGSQVVTFIPDTSQVVVGMFVRATGIPAGALVYAFDASTITLADVNGNPIYATSTVVSAQLALGVEILLTYPPLEPQDETLTSDAVVVPALSGIRQTSINFIAGVRQLQFMFLSEALYQTMKLFCTSWALLGNSFLYWDDQTASPTTYELDVLNNAPSNPPAKLAGKGENAYVWELDLNFRRVL